MTEIIAVIIVVFIDELYRIIRLRRGLHSEYKDDGRIGKLVKLSLDTIGERETCLQDLFEYDVSIYYHYRG